MTSMLNTPALRDHHSHLHAISELLLISLSQGTSNSETAAQVRAVEAAALVLEYVSKNIATGIPASRVYSMLQAADLSGVMRPDVQDYRKAAMKADLAIGLEKQLHDVSPAALCERMLPELNRADRQLRGC